MVYGFINLCCLWTFRVHVDCCGSLVYIEFDVNCFCFVKKFKNLFFKTSLKVSFPLYVIGSGTARIIEANKSVERIGNFLQLEEISPKNVGERSPDLAVSIKNGNFKWDDTICLKNIDLTIKKGQFVAIIGKVGSGKSSLLHAILGEIEKDVIS